MGRKLDKRNIHKFLMAESIGKNVRLAARDAKLNSAKHAGPFNQVSWDNGISWFNSGLTLKDADEKFRDDASFINGFNYAERLKSINEKLEKYGAEWYENGNSLENIPPRYSDNESFIKGYNEAKNKSKGL